MDTHFPLKTPKIQAAIQSWWAAFARAEHALNEMFMTGEGGPTDILMNLMNEHFHAVHPEMMWEFGKGTQKNHVLRIAPERNYELEPLARWMKDLAPELEFFDIQIDRPATPWNEIIEHTDSRFSWPSPAEIYFTLETGKFNRIDIVFHAKTKDVGPKFETDCFLLTEQLLGEKVVTDWVGYIDAELHTPKGLIKKTYSSFPARAINASGLAGAVRAKMANIKNDLPPVISDQDIDNQNWSIVKIERQEDDPHHYMNDMYLAVTSDADLFRSLYSAKSRFHGGRHSTAEDCFVLIKIDGADSARDLGQADSRHDIQNAVDDALRAQGLGGVVMGGMGQIYMFIIVALSNENAGLKCSLDTLRTLKLGSKTWLQYCDARRQMEWIGIYDDTPEPNLNIR